MLRYVIMERTPFPGTWQPTATYLLQQAEYAQFRNQRYYHERAVRIGKYPSDSLLAYGWDDAMRLLDYIKAYRAKYRVNAEYKLIGHIVADQE